jgi:hypothetical protein
VDLADLVHAGRAGGHVRVTLLVAPALDGAGPKAWSLARWVRDPFVHFLAIGVAILAL